VEEECSRRWRSGTTPAVSGDGQAQSRGEAAQTEEEEAAGVSRTDLQI
jgi:hypothetical protein